jgi:hypothetical protein
MKNAVSLNITTHDSCKNRLLGGTCHLYLQCDKNLRSGLRLLVTTSVVRRSLILVILMMVVIVSPKRRFLQESHRVTSQKTSFFI